MMGFRMCAVPAYLLGVLALTTLCGAQTDNVHALTVVSRRHLHSRSSFRGILQFPSFEPGPFSFSGNNRRQSSPFGTIQSPPPNPSSRFPGPPPPPPTVSFPNPEEFQRASAFLSGFVIVFVLADGNMCTTRTSSSLNNSIQRMGADTFVRTYGYLTGTGECEEGARGFGVAVLTAQAFAEVERLGEVCNTRSQSSGQVFRQIIGEGIDIDVSGSVGAEAGCPIVPDNENAQPNGAGANGAEPNLVEAIVAEASGTEANGTEANGTEANGAEANGAEANGAEANGAEAIGAEANGAEANGAEANDAEANDAEANGAGANGAGANGAGANGAGASGAGTNSVEPKSITSAESP